MQYFDVIILGGGPAGCATALSLLREAPSVSVAIVESSSYGAERIGETLPPNIDGLLTHLGIWPSFLQCGPMEAYGTRACWGTELVVENEFIFQKQGKGWHLDRRAFDRMLASEAERAGVRLFSNARVVAHQRTHEGWSVTSRHKDGVVPMECRFVVDSAGRNSSFAIQQGARHIECDRLAGCFLFFSAPVEVPDTYTLVEAFEHGWTYSAALPDGRLVAAILSDTDILRHFDLHSAGGWLRAVDQTPQTRKRLAGAEPCGAPFTRSASSRRLDIAAGDGWIAAGDAASTFDPLSSQGIYKALRGGIFASYAIIDALRGKSSNKYQRFLSDEYDEYLDIRTAYYAQEQRWPDAPFWRRRHERITLDPERTLQAATVANGQSNTHLTSGEIDLIREVCSRPCPAHQVVREFIARSPRHVSHRRVVLAVQRLLETGVIRALP